MSDEHDIGTTTAANGSTPPSVAEAAAEVKQQAKVVVGQAATKAKEVYQRARDLAGQRADQTRSVIEDKPYAAVGLVFLAGLIVGHILGAGRPRVIYLRDPHAR